MILVDTSVWIDFFGRTPGRAGNELARMIDVAEPLALTGVIVTEILQGIRRDVIRIEQLLETWDLLEPAGYSTYREAADLSRLARSNGVTLTTADCLIAAIAIEHGVRLFSLDRDFWRAARFLPLILYAVP